jgi:hypothetical protein
MKITSKYMQIKLIMEKSTKQIKSNMESKSQQIKSERSIIQLK